MLWTSVGGCMKPAPVAYLTDGQPDIAWDSVPSPCATATNVGPGWVCQPVYPPGWIVSCWYAVSQAVVSPHDIKGVTVGEVKVTVFGTPLPFPRTRTVFVAVAVLGTPITTDCETGPRAV